MNDSRRAGAPKERQFSVFSYNPLSVLEEHRLQEIIDEAKTPIIALQGTKTRLNNNINKGDKYRVRRQGVYDVYEWGWAKGRYTNKSAGTTIMLDRRYFPRSRVKCLSPGAELQG